MTSATEPATDVVFELSSGLVTAQRWGDPAGRLVVCVPGLSQDERSYDDLGPRLADAGAGAGRHVVAIAPRGRGRSQVTPAGTYGWPAHAADVAEIATQLGADTFDYVGWSFGGFLGMQVAADHPGRIRRLVLLDALGRPEPSAIGPIVAGLERLGAVYAKPADYFDTVAGSGVIDGDPEAWREYLEGDMVEAPGGYTTRTDKDAVLEDTAHGATRDPYELWRSLTMPTLLVRAALPILPALGFVVTEADRDRFLATVPDAKVIEVDTNHYSLGRAAGTAAAIKEFLDA
jgi:pimeloyl-ACP methyl ester carboxylesterase